MPRSPSRESPIYIAYSTLSKDPLCHNAISNRQIPPRLPTTNPIWIVSMLNHCIPSNGILSKIPAISKLNPSIPTAQKLCCAGKQTALPKPTLAMGYPVVKCNHPRALIQAYSGWQAYDPLTVQDMQDLRALYSPLRPLVGLDDPVDLMARKGDRYPKVANEAYGVIGMSPPIINKALCMVVTWPLGTTNPKLSSLRIIQLLGDTGAPIIEGPKQPSDKNYHQKWGTLGIPTHPGIHGITTGIPPITRDPLPSLSGGGVGGIKHYDSLPTPKV
ncbi:hypothetical protein G9A89_000480, partial [Geosiphon pyriformis]